MAEVDASQEQQAPIASPPARRVESPRAAGWQAWGRVLLAVLALAGAYYFAAEGVSLVRHYHEIIRTAYDAKGPPEFPEAGDVTVFYTAGRVIVSDGRSGIYDKDYFIPQVFETQGWPPGDLYAGDGAWSKFYNPPFFALLLSPLTLFDLHTAYLIVVGVNLAAGALLLYLMGRIMRWQQPATILLGLGLFSFTPLYFVFQHAQPSLLLALVLAASFLFMDAGKYRAGPLMLVLAGLKPQWLGLPTLVLAQRDRRSLLWFALSVIAVIAIPFLLVGPRGLEDYIHIVLDRGSGDISNQEFSSAILSWSGFVRALTGQPQPVLWGLLAVVTLVVFLFICANGDSRLTTAASIVATLLIIPHSHPQDWVVVAVAGAIALGRRAPFVSHLVTGACLLAIYFAANDWPHESYRVSIGVHTVYWITPAGAALLAWFGLAPLVEARIAAAPAPSLWRFEWESAPTFRVQPWQAAGLMFSVGIVLGMSVALALVKGPDLSGFSLNPASTAGSPSQTAASLLSDPRFPVAEPAGSVVARASSGWAFAGRGSRDAAFPVDLAAPVQAQAHSNPASDFLVSRSSGQSADGDQPQPRQEVLAAGAETDVPFGTIDDPAAAESRAVAGDADSPESLGETFRAGAVPLPDGSSLPVYAPVDAFGGATDDSLATDAFLTQRDSLLHSPARILQSTTAVARVSSQSLRALSRDLTALTAFSDAGVAFGRAGRTVIESQKSAASLLKQRAGLLDATAEAQPEKPLAFPADARALVAEAVSDVSLNSVSSPGSSRVAASALRRIAENSGSLSLRLAGLARPEPPSSASGGSPEGADGRPAASSAPSDVEQPSAAGRRVLDPTAGVTGMISRATAASRDAGAIGGGVAAGQVKAPTGAVFAALQGWSAEVAALRRMVDLVSSAHSRRSDATAATVRINGAGSRLAAPASSLGRLVGAAGALVSVPNPAGYQRALVGLVRGAGTSLGAVEDMRNKAYIGAELQYQARQAEAARAAGATSTAIASRPTAVPTSTPIPERTDCAEIQATGARTPREAGLLATTCAPTPVPPTPVPPTAEPPPPTPVPDVRVSTPPPPPPSAPPAKCTRVVVARTPSLVPLAEGGFRLDAELATSEPAGCTEWPAAFSASATISVTSGSLAYQGTWSCESGRNPTAGVPSSTHFAFFCTIGSKAGPPAGSSFFNITVTALSDSGAVLGTSNQSFPPPSP